ncbi:tetratricopeptide repeat protein [Hymenobacter jeollabukensis]|uniref:Tetratricopeptide repeat protein n=1 Tax=Hymenobacter jeollabukensis TaxID=2025313 RepID=A0A5R8WJG6_9BACT|nr:hypothetical protein [Hymenobacter jeollabukensis]TLM88876.1 hypothetical protein FDY95_22095 [Hymenobacter jeollabukensis]
MDSEQDLTLIDAYLNGTLSAEEQAAVVERLARDNDFQELYKFTQSVQRVARQQERRRIKAMLQALDDKSASPEPVDETGSKVIPITSQPQDDLTIKAHTPKVIRWPLTSIGIAASIAAILLVWQPTRSSNDEVFAAYAGTTASTVTLPESVGPEVAGGMRGAETVVEGFSAAETEALAQAVYMLQAKEYDNAKVLLNELVQAKGEQPILLQNLAVAQLNSNEVAEAVRNLESLRQHPTQASRNQVEFDLALGYIKQGKLRQARALLQRVAQSRSTLARPAAAILDKMRWWF